MRRALALPPGGFVASLAAGALAVAAWDRGYRALSEALLWIGAGLFAAVAALLVARAVARPRELAGDLTSPARVFGVFTLPAALAVLADRLWADGYHAPTLVLWAAAVCVWGAAAYGIPLLLVTGSGGRLSDWVTPAWAGAILATQTLVATATLLSQRWAPTFFLFAALTFFLVAWGLYLVVGSWIGQRLVLGDVDPRSLTARHWIPISALATSGFAATRLVTAADRYDLVESVRPVVEAFAVTAWTGCAAWFGFVVALEGWRLARIGPSGFVAPNAAFAVYAVAAYAIASHEVATVFGLAAVGWVAEIALWVGIAGAATAVAFTALWLGRASVAKER